MGRILKINDRTKPTPRDSFRAMVERIPAEEWITEQQALALLWNGARNIPTDYARAAAPLHELQGAGHIRRRGGSPYSGDGGEVYRHKSTPEMLEEGNNHIAAADPTKVYPWFVHLWDTAAQKFVKVKRGSQQEIDERRRIARDRQAAIRRHLGLGSTESTVVVQAGSAEPDGFLVEHAPDSKTS